MENVDGRTQDQKDIQALKEKINYLMEWAHPDHDRPKVEKLKKEIQELQRQVGSHNWADMLNERMQRLEKSREAHSKSNQELFERLSALESEVYKTIIQRLNQHENRHEQAYRWLRKDFDRIEALEKLISKDTKSDPISIDTRPYYDRIAELADDMHKARGEGMRDVGAVVVGVSTCGGGGAGGGPCTIGGLNFIQALEHMKCGRNVRRESWPNAGYWINASTLSIENCKDCGASENIDWNDFIANDWKVELTK